MSLEKINDSSFADNQELQKSDEKSKGEIITSEKDFDSEIRAIQGEAQINEESDKNQVSSCSTLYDEILKKLDIKKKDYKQEIKDSILQDNIVKNKIEKAIKQDFLIIQNLVKSKLINSDQEQNLKNKVLKKAFDSLVQTEKIRRTTIPANDFDKSIQKIEPSKALDEFTRVNPDFFAPSGRREVLNYLQSGNVSLGKDELGKISEIIKIVEQSAIDRYLQKTEHERTLMESNETAKRRLTANAQKSNFGGNLSRTFTREQIGKMSGSEFAKYEVAIMDALKKGLIK